MLYGHWGNVGLQRLKMAGNAVLREKLRHKVPLVLCRVVQRAADVPSGKAAQLHTKFHAAHAHAPDSRVGLRCQAGMERLRPLPFSGAPTADAIYEAAKAVDTGAGVLLMVKNYTGDRGQFGMACEMCEMDDINAKIVIADDDVAVKDSTFTAGRRGVAGAILGYKIVCAAAEEGKSHDELVELANRVNANVRSMGFGLTSCTTPAKGAPTFEIGDDEMEIGVGLHGEPGRQRTKLMPADEIVGLMTQNCLDDLPFKAGDEVAVMVNGLGGTPLMEQYIAYNKVAQMLKDTGIKVFKSYVNEYCTSIDMAGCSVSLLRLDDEMKKYLDYPVEIPYAIF